MTESVLTVLAGVAALVCAAVMYRGLSPSTLRTRLCILMLAEGCMLLTSATGLVRLLPDVVPLSFAKTGHPLSDAVLVALHLPTVAVMVNSRLLSPFRSGWGVWVTVTVGALLGTATLVMPGYAWVAQPDGSASAGPRGVSPVQRAALNGLRQRLGLDREQAQSLEAEISNSPHTR